MHLVLEMSDAAVADFGRTPDDFVQQLRLAAAMKWYEAGVISQARAAEIAGVSREKFLSATGQFQVSIMQLTREELAQELARV